MFYHKPGHMGSCLGTLSCTIDGVAAWGKSGRHVGSWTLCWKILHEDFGITKTLGAAGSHNYSETGIMLVSMHEMAHARVQSVFFLSP